MGHLDCSGDGVAPFVPRKTGFSFPYSLVPAVSTGRARSAHVTTKRLATSSPLSPFGTVEISCGIFGSRRQTPPSIDHP
jgi:hypothetical protein